MRLDPLLGLTLLSRVGKEGLGGRASDHGQVQVRFQQAMDYPQTDMPLPGLLFLAGMAWHGCHGGS